MLGGLEPTPARSSVRGLVHGDVEAALGEFVSGGESGDAGTEHRDQWGAACRTPGSDGFAS